MSARLHWFLLVVTLLDLAFVQVTEVVPGVSLLPMWFLAAVSPLLRRLQRFRVYRAFWNLCVLLLFGMLAHHASATGLTHLLEDGLLLAALCQVHLLNNIGARQQSDLVFLNSLLIVFVTSFFSADEHWLLLFVLHAVVFVPALQMRVCTDRGDAHTATCLTLRNGIVHAGLTAAVTAAVFVVWPRDFSHQGWLQTAFARQMGLAGGLADRIRLDDRAPAVLSDEIVMRIEAMAPTTWVPTHWRGVAFPGFHDGTWLPRHVLDGRRLRTDPEWHVDFDGVHRRSMPANDGAWRVTLERVQPWLPLPLAACELRLVRDGGVLVDPRPYGVMALARVDGEVPDDLVFEVRTTTAPTRGRMDAGAREQLLDLPLDRITLITGALAASLRRSLGEGAGPAAIATACADWLRENRTYELPGRSGFASSFTAFLAGEGGGHCEYFASALALMLRGLGVPCRVVGGYLATEREGDDTVVVRARHAHAWVEALLPDDSWLTVDATPSTADLELQGAADSWWSGAAVWLKALWNDILGFDASGRRRLYSALAETPGALLRGAAARPLTSAALLVAPLLLLWLRRRRRRPPVVASLLAAARGAGLRLQTGETPRELLARAHAAAVATERVAALEAAIGRHEHARYRASP